MTDINTRIDFYIFDDNETIEEAETKPMRHSVPEEYVILHESNIRMLHNDIYECLEALYLVLDYAHQDRSKGEARGYYENLLLIFNRFIRIGNLIDADLMREQHKNGPGRNIQAVLMK